MISVMYGRRETLSTAVMFQYNIYRDTDPKKFKMNLKKLSQPNQRQKSWKKGFLPRVKRGKGKIHMEQVSRKTEKAGKHVLTQRKLCSRKIIS
jgi:hypothetical protein